jgi:RES domain-containing protein
VRFWRISSNHPGIYTATDLTGEGARRAGARWNVKGTPAVYASFHLATAVLETLVHAGARKQTVERWIVGIDVNDTRFKDKRRGVVEVFPNDLPAGWNNNPPSAVSQMFGADQFKRGRLGFAVPSTIVEEELNLVLNPLHPSFHTAVEATVIRKFAFDPRLLY